MRYFHVYTGEGAGKTTSALGLALRSVGHKHKVIVIQFMKWRKDIGEYKIQKLLAPYYEIYQFGRVGWHGFKNLTAIDKQMANNALTFTAKITEDKKPNLLILDELHLVLHCGLVQLSHVLLLIDKLLEITDIVSTGRFAPKKLLERADFVVKISPEKYPREIITKKGIQY